MKQQRLRRKKKNRKNVIKKQKNCGREKLREKQQKKQL